MKPLVRRERADEDAHAAIEHYLAEDALDAAASFVDELERAYDHIQRHPATGSPRYAHALNLPGLRFWPLRRYPYLVFYIEGREAIEVWRVLHGSRDIPAWLQSEE
jgi:toxin ParE1/3/4